MAFWSRTKPGKGGATLLPREPLGQQYRTVQGEGMICTCCQQLRIVSAPTATSGFHDVCGYSLADVRGEAVGSLGIDEGMGKQFKHITQLLRDCQYNTAELETSRHTCKVRAYSHKIYGVGRWPITALSRALCPSNVPEGMRIYCLASSLA